MVQRIQALNTGFDLVGMNKWNGPVVETRSCLFKEPFKKPFFLFFHFNLC